MAGKTKRLKPNEIRVIKLNKIGIFRVLTDGVFHLIGENVLGYVGRIGLISSTSLSPTFDELTYYARRDCEVYGCDADDWVEIHRYIDDYFDNNISFTAKSLYEKVCYKTYFFSCEKPYSMLECPNVIKNRKRKLKNNEIRVVKLDKEGIIEVLQKIFQNIGLEKLGLFDNAKDVSTRMIYDNSTNELTFYAFNSCRGDVENIEKYISENMDITTDDLFYPGKDKPYKIVIF